MRRQEGADCGPSPKDHPTDKHAEFRVPAPQNLTEIRDLVPGSSVGKWSRGRVLNVRG